MDRGHVSPDAVTALHHAKAEQDRDRPDVRDQQIQITRLADVGNVVVGGDQKIGRQRHRLPRHHEHVCVVGQQHQRHAGKEQVIFQAQQGQRIGLHGFEITGAEQRHAERCAAQQDQEKRGERIETQDAAADRAGPAAIRPGWQARRATINRLRPVPAKQSRRQGKTTLVIRCGLRCSASPSIPSASQNTTAVPATSKAIHPQCPSRLFFHRLADWPYCARGRFYSLLPQHPQ